MRVNKFVCPCCGKEFVLMSKETLITRDELLQLTSELKALRDLKDLLDIKEKGENNE